jgi:hypothetical protein
MKNRRDLDILRRRGARDRLDIVAAARTERPARVLGFMLRLPVPDKKEFHRRILPPFLVEESG